MPLERNRVARELASGELIGIPVGLKRQWSAVCRKSDVEVEFLGEFIDLLAKSRQTV